MNLPETSEKTNKVTGGGGPSSEPLHSSDRVRDAYLERLEGGYYPVSFKELSFWEGYIEGRFGVAVVFDVHSANGKERFCIWMHSGDLASMKSYARPDLEAIEINRSFRRDEIGVLVGNVQHVQAVEVLSFPSLVGLYRVEDEIPYGVGRAGVWFLSLKGGTAPSPVGSTWKLRPGVRLASIGLDEKAVAVIKGGPEVMERISKDGWGVPGHGLPETPFPEAFCVLLGAERFGVCINPALEDTLEFVDMMFGPL